MADVDGFGLVIWDGKQIFRLHHKVFKPDPAQGLYTIASENFTFNDGVLGMALSKRLYPDEPRIFIFRPMSSLGIYMTTSDDLARSSNGDNITYYGNSEVLPSQATVQAISAQGTLFFGLTREIGIGCWNRYTPLIKSNIVRRIYYFLTSHLNGICTFIIILQKHLNVILSTICCVFTF